MDYHILSKTINKVINKEFEKFYQIILSNISHIPDDSWQCLEQEYRALVTNTTASMYFMVTNK